MKDEFNLDKIGRRTPYNVPAGFFETITQDTIAEAEKRANKTKNKVWLWQPITAAASVFLLLTVGYFLFTGESQGNEQIAKKETVITTEVPLATYPDSIAVAANRTKPRIVDRNVPFTLDATTKPSDKALTSTKAGQGVKPETLEELLETLSDDELMQLTALVESELYVYEQTFINEQQD